MMNNRTNTKNYVRNMGLKPKQNRRPTNAQNKLKLQGKLVCSYDQQN